MPGRSDDLASVVTLLGAKVRSRREALGMSQEGLGLQIGMDRKSVQNIEYGRASTPRGDGSYGPGNPKLDTIFKLAAVLEVDLAYLVDPDQPLRAE